MENLASDNTSLCFLPFRCLPSLQDGDGWDDFGGGGGDGDGDGYHHPITPSPPPHLKCLN